MAKKVVLGPGFLLVTWFFRATLRHEDLTSAYGGSFEVSSGLGDKMRLSAPMVLWLGCAGRSPVSVVAWLSWVVCIGQGCIAWDGHGRRHRYI